VKKGKRKNGFESCECHDDDVVPRIINVASNRPAPEASFDRALMQLGQSPNFPNLVETALSTQVMLGILSCLLWLMVPLWRASSWPDQQPCSSQNDLSVLVG